MERLNISKQEFSIDRWVEQTSQISQDPNQINVDVWCDFLWETINLFKKMGSAMAMAFSGTLLSNSFTQIRCKL